METTAPQGESFLIPKINTQTSTGPLTVDLNHSQSPPKMSSRTKKILMGIGIFFFVLIVLVVIPGFLVYQKGMALATEGKKLSEVAKTGNLEEIKKEIPKFKKSLNSFQTTYALISWTKFLPFVGSYSSDVIHLTKAGNAALDASEVVLTTVEPYMDVLGFTKKGEGDDKTGEQTTQERIDFIVKAIPDILPKIDEISGKVRIVNDEISKINADKYPKKFRGISLREKIKDGQDTVAQVSDFIVNGKPVLEAAPYLLGMDSPRRYLILFQNDKELRPTGGFMTAYSIMKVDKAKFEPVSSDDIYNLDAKYKPKLEAPDPIVKYIKGPYVLSKNLRLRDMNWNPDFAQSMETVTDATKEVGISGVDGIIAMDTGLLVNILNVIGPIGVPGFGNFSTDKIPECNCAQVIHELESFADVEGPIIWDPVTGKIILRPPNSDNRKKIIGPLMNSILANAMGQPKEKLPALFEGGFRSLMEKHVLFYLYDEGTQKALADFGLGGIIKDAGKSDYLHINDANLGGRKSNLYVTQEVDQEIEIGRDGGVTKTVTITYKNPAKQDGWLNSVLPNWVRIYVPKGSQLIAAEGLEDKEDPYEELGKTVYAGGFRLRPEGVSKVTFKYKLPFKVSKEYNLLIQKQPGTDGPLYTIHLGRHEEELLLKTDKEIKIRI